ncbi:MAG: peptidylprolyl isomerase, partial [Candidatus Margulisiibacteriota bacterium]
QLKNDIIASKTRQALQASVSLTPSDIEYLNEEYQVKDLFISKFSSANTVIEDETLFQNVTKIRQSISDSESFDQAVLQQYPLLKDAPGYTWVTINQLTPNIARALVTLTANEISQPIKTLNGYHIIELKSKRSVDESKQLTQEQLLDSWGKITLFDYMTDIQQGREMKILNPNLRALKFKREGRFDDAIMAYQGSVSLDPSNPYPNLNIAKIQLMKGDVASAKQSLLKAEIKESLVSDTIVLPEIHLLLAKIYDEQNFSTKRDAQYDKLINEASSLVVLDYLKTALEASNDRYRLTKVNMLIDEKSATESAILDKIESPDNSIIADEFLTE